MRIFSAFGVLGLLHVARGGELDQFAAHRAQRARSQQLGGQFGRDTPLDAPKPVQSHKRTSGDASSEPLKAETLTNNAKRHILIPRLHDVSDKDKDGGISYEEFMKTLLFSWNSTEHLETALTAFHLPSAHDIFKSMDEDGDGYISMNEHSTYSKRSLTPETKPLHCSALRAKAELYISSMGNQQRAQSQRKPTSSRTGSRKAKKTVNENDPLELTPTHQSRPRPRPAFRRTLDAVNSLDNDEEAAAEVLMSIAGVGRKPKRTKSAMECIFEQVCNVGLDDGDATADEDEIDQLEFDEDEELAEMDNNDHINSFTTPPPDEVRPVFDIPFEVPFKGATRDLRGIKSSTAFHDFRVQLALKMETQLSLLSQIGYVPSYKPKNPKPLPKLLEDEEAWESLLSDVEEYILSSRAKKGGKGFVKAFSIAIFDMSGPDSKDTGKKGAKKKVAETEAATPQGELLEHELLRKLEKRHHCSKCDRSCIILQTGDHYALTHADMATWVMLLKRHQATIDCPPDDLKLDVARQQSAKKAIQATTAKIEGTTTTPPWIEQMMMIMGASAIQTTQALQFATRGSTDAPVTPGPSHFMESAFPTPNSPTPVLSKRPANPNSFIEIDDSPDIFTWLANLDMDPGRGKLNVNYQQYAEALQQAGLLELADLSDLEADKLQELGGMPFACPTHQVLKCGAYFATAEGMCNAGHRNLVETCILSSPCSSICDCISNVAAAAKGNAVMYVQHPDSSVNLYHPDHEKRLFFLAWIFYGLIAIAILEYTALGLASLITHFAGSDINDSRWMDVKVWESGDPPDCSMYLYWGSCGAILSGKSHECPGGGIRVYGNSCKDHFRYGSRGCGFWGLGCQSICYNVNYARCPCSIFTWEQLNDIEVETSQADLDSITVTQPSQCRSACEDKTECVAFIIYPANGDKNQKNCVLKQGEIFNQREVKEVTSFLRDGRKPGEQCGDTTKKSGNFWAEFGKPDFARRSELTKVLNKRVNEGKAYAFDGRDGNFNRWLGFLAYLYVQNWIMRERTVIRYPSLQRQIGDARMRTQQTGFPNLYTAAAPRWSPQEVNARLTNLVRNMMYRNAIESNPVESYLNTVVGTNNGAYMREQWPQAVRDLLIANQAVIQPPDQDTSDPNIPTWDGRRADTSSRSYWPTHPGVQVGLNSNSQIGQWYQTGNSGPYGLEAAFLLSAQLAGINWRYVWNRGIGSNVIQAWWTGAIIRRRSRNGLADEEVECIMDDGLNEDGTQGTPRRIGIQQVVTTEATDAHGRAGVYFALDLDPDLDDDDPNHNVFLFVLHTMDRSSVINQPNGVLNNAPMIRYTPAQDQGSARYADVNNNAIVFSPRVRGETRQPTRTGRTRVVAHAHSTMMRRSDFVAWINQHPTQNAANIRNLPGYTPFGFNHLYVISEDTASDSQRNTWLNRPGRDEL